MRRRAIDRRQRAAAVVIAARRLERGATFRAASDEQALEEAATYDDELRAAVFRLVRCPATAADIVQELWLRVAGRRLGGVGHVRGYLHRAATNLAADWSRAERRRCEVADGEAAIAAAACPRPDPERAALARLEAERLVAAIRALPPRCRAVLLLRKGAGLSHATIAARLGIAEKTVQSHLVRAMLHCRRLHDPAP